VIVLVMSAVFLALASLWLLRPTPLRQEPPPAGAASPERLVVKVLSVRPHDAGAYTQGLLLHGGSLFESTGLYGRSSLREVAAETGDVKRQVSLPASSFGEGLALVEDRLIQLTWQEGRALVYGLADLRQVGELRYEGEGWGLCWDGHRLVMSDGSDRLTFRDPKTFAVLDEVRVTVAGRPAERLNELECVEGTIYANVWQTDDILRIDPATGKVTAVVDASGLLSPSESRVAEVLNGIAWDPARRTFLITGKLWPKMFEVTMVSPP
jgi:glutaminyl-peptide cyclotransferase